MKSPDERIETVLAALRDAEPPADLQWRIQAALRDADESPADRHGWFRLPAMPMPVMAALIVTVMACAVLWMLHSIHTTHSRETIQAKHEALRAGEPIRHTPILAEKSREVSRRASVPRKLDTTLTVARENEHAEPDEQRNIPTPALPMTHQELLLLQLAHRNQPKQLATLVADARETTFQREKEQVQEFFQPAPLPPADEMETSIDTTGGNE